MKKQHHIDLNSEIPVNRRNCSNHLFEDSIAYKMDNNTNTSVSQADLVQSPSSKSLATRSVISGSSSSRKSSASLVAAKARARTEAMRARSTFVKKENELLIGKAQLKVEEARMEAALTTLKQEKEVAAALAEAEVLESAAAAAEVDSKLDSKSLNIAAIPHDSTEDRTRDYIEKHSEVHSSNLTLLQHEYYTPPTAQDNIPEVRELKDSLSVCVKQHPDSEELQAMKKNASHNYPEKTDDFSFTRRFHPTTTSPRVQPPQSLFSDKSDMNNLAIYMARRELSSSGMTKFDDHSDNYRSWKATFKNVIKGLNLTCHEELDL